MKRIYILGLLTFSLISFSQIPAGYYNSATGTGYTLKTQLYNIIKNNTNSNSSATYNELWNLFTQPAFRDNFYENDGSLLDVYSEKPAGVDAYQYTSTTSQCGNYNSEGDCYNREHTMPQSVFNSEYPMYSDAHFVLPTDGSVNGKRGNDPFGKVNSPTWTSTNGSKIGLNLNSGYSAGYSARVFEPIDEFKGDIARCMLYFATRYQDVVAGYSYDMLNGTSNQVFSQPFLNILLTWHNQDAVSAYEIAKNNAVYTFQNNRNPFIDHPEYVAAIWGQPLSLDNDLIDNNIKIYPNPVTEKTIHIQTEIVLEQIELISINGQILQVIKNPKSFNNEYAIENLNSGFYFLKIDSQNQSITKKIMVN